MLKHLGPVDLMVLSLSEETTLSIQELPKSSGALPSILISPLSATLIRDGRLFRALSSFV